MGFPLSKVQWLSDYAGSFALSVECLNPDCRHERSLAAAALALRAGRDARVVDVVDRLRCSLCRGRKIEVSVVGIPRQ